MSELVGGIHYEVDIETGKMLAAQRKVEKSLSSIGDAGDKLTSKFTQVAAGITAAIASIAVGVMLDKLIATQRQFDVMFASLKTMTGGANEAGQAFDRLRKFSETTPYTLEQSVKGFVKLKALGLDPSEKAMTSFGNTASAMGKDLMQMIEAVADASTGEFERLKEFGIKAKKEGDDVQLTFRGTTTTVKNSSEAITGYLVKIGETDFAGAMSERMNTLDGNISNLEDSLSALYLTISQAGIGESVAAGVRKATEAISEMTTSVNEGGLTEYFDALKPYIAAAEVAVVTLAGAMTSKLIIAFVATAVEAYTAASAIGVATVAARGFSAVIAALGGPIGIAITGLTLLAINWDKIAGSSKKAADISEESARRIAKAQKKSDDRMAKDLQGQLKDAEKGLSDTVVSLKDKNKETIYGGKILSKKDVEDLEDNKDAYIASIAAIKKAIDSAGWSDADKSVMPDPAKSRSSGCNTKEKGPGKAKFDSASYLAGLERQTVDAWGAINLVESEAIRKNDALLAKNDISKKEHSDAVTFILKNAALDRKEIADRELAALQDNAMRADEFFKEQESKAEDREKQRNKSKTSAQIDTLQVRAQSGGLGDKENLTRAVGAADIAEVEAKRVEAVRITDLEGAQIYADQKVAIEDEMNAKIAALRDGANKSQLTATSDIFGSLASVMKDASGEQSGIYQAMFAAQKAFAIASAMVSIQTGAAEAYKLGWPLGIPAAAAVLAQGAGVISTITGTSISGGRQYGGPVSAGSMYRVNETGAPEMFTAGNGQQFMMPTSGGQVTAADKVGGGNVQWNVIINNAPAGTTSSVDQSAKTVTVTVAEIANQLRSNTGPVWAALRGSSNVQGRM